MIMTIGIDAHKHTHTAVALNEVGVEVAEGTFAASLDGLAQLYEWAQSFDERRWAVEDCRDVTAHLEQMLLDHGEEAFRVPPALTGPARRASRTAGKSDPIDAAAVARALLAHGDLPRVEPVSEDHKLLKKLVSYRDQTVQQRSELICHVRVDMSAIDPEWNPNNLTSLKQLNAALQQCQELPSSQSEVLVIQLKDLIGRTETINKLKLRIVALAQLLAPELFEVEGVGGLIAASLIVRVANIDRFATPAKFAMYSGCAPIPASSGNTNRMRLNRGGNRQLNSIIYRISISQTNSYQPAQDFIAKKLAEGHTKKEARRALKTHIAKRIYEVMKQAS